MHQQESQELDGRLQRLESIVREITERNARVEVDKAWETSSYRVLSISFVTWIITSLVFWVIDVERALINALIPTVGFYLSTQTLPFLKEKWVRRNFKKY